MPFSLIIGVVTTSSVDFAFSAARTVNAMVTVSPGLMPWVRRRLMNWRSSTVPFDTISPDS